MNMAMDICDASSTGLPCVPQVEADKWARAGKEWPAEEQAKHKAAIQQRYDQEGSPYFASARLWDDGVSVQGRGVYRGRKALTASRAQPECSHRLSVGPP